MATYTSVQNGDWNDVATWGGGGWPNVNGDVADISHEVTYNVDDVVNAVQIKVRSGGLIIFATDQDTGVLVDAVSDAMYIYENGGIRIGTEQNPLPKEYKCRIRFKNTGSTQYRFRFESGANGECSIYGDPEYYGSQKYGELAATWSAGQVFYVDGDVSAKWSAGHRLFIHKNDGGTAWNTAGDIYEVDTVGEYDSENDWTPITIVEAAPDLTYNAEAIIINVSRNIQFDNPDASFEVGSISDVTERAKIRFLGYFGSNVNNVMFMGLDRVYSYHRKLVYEDCTVVCCNLGFTGYDANVVNCDGVGTGQYLASNSRAKAEGGKIACCRYGAMACMDTIIDNVHMIGVYFVYYQNSATYKNCLIEQSDRMYRYSYGDGLIKDCIIGVAQWDATPSAWMNASCLQIENTIINDVLYEFMSASNTGINYYIEDDDGDFQAPSSGSDWVLKMVSSVYLIEPEWDFHVLISQNKSFFKYLEAGEHTITFKIYPKDWDTVLDQDDVFIEVEYFDDVSALTSRAVAVTDTGTFANDGWRELSTTFTQAIDGVVYFNLKLTRHDANAVTLVDPMVLIDDVYAGQIRVANGNLVFEVPEQLSLDVAHEINDLTVSVDVEELAVNVTAE